MAQAEDKFDHLADNTFSPARRAFAVAPHDSNALPALPKALFVGSSGTLALRAVDSASDVTLEVIAGQIIPVRASHVRASGTSASGIVGLA